MEKTNTGSVMTVKIQNLEPFVNAPVQTYTNPKSGVVYQQFLGTYNGVKVNCWVAEGHLNFLSEVEFNVLPNSSAWSTLPQGKLDNKAAFGL